MGETLQHHLPAAHDSLTTINPAKRRNQDQQWNTEGQRGPAIHHDRSPPNRRKRIQATRTGGPVDSGLLFPPGESRRASIRPGLDLPFISSVSCASFAPGGRQGAGRLAA